jgi:hypothetical protein
MEMTMKWTRGKGTKREARSEATGATYVYADGLLRVARTKGAWEHIGGACATLEDAKRIAEDHDQWLAGQCQREALVIAEGYVLAKEREKLRDLYRDVVTQGPCLGVYRAYCYLRKRGATPDELVAHMEALSPVDRAYLGRAFEDFYKAGMRVQ